MTQHAKSRSLRYLGVALRWMILAAFLFTLTMAGGVYLADHLTKVYTASSELMLMPKAAGPVTASTDAGSSDFTLEFETIDSREVRLAVIRDLDLKDKWTLRAQRSTDGELTDNEALTLLEHRITVENLRGTNIVKISTTSEEPAEAAALANAVVDEYQASRRAVDPSSVNSRILSRAIVPRSPSHPNLRLCYAITAALAGLTSVMVASSVEVIFLISRAAESSGRELIPAR